MQTVEHVRLDKWLWAVRLYRTRSLAITACQAGHVKIGGQSGKPSREVRLGEIICALAGRGNRTGKVLALLEKRVGAKCVSQFLEDQTPREEYDRARQEAAQAVAHFPQGFGRPTKKQRRQLLGVIEPLDAP
jgi:ribosome-associated heat shock protein Hsp15